MSTGYPNEVLIRRFPTPNLVDRLEIQRRSRKKATYKPIEFGTPHPKHPELLLLDQQPYEESDEFIVETWGTVPADQELFNWSIQYLAANNVDRIVIRSSLVKRDEYQPPTWYEPDPQDATLLLVDQRVRQLPMDSAYAKVFVEVNQVYEKLPGPEVVSYDTSQHGQIVTITSQRVQPATVSIAPSATVDEQLATEENGRVQTLQRREVQSLFGAKRFSVEISEFIPPRFRPLAQAVTTAETVEGIASMPTLGVGELARSEEQLTEFTKRVTVTSRSGSYLVLTERSIFPQADGAEGTSTAEIIISATEPEKDTGFLVWQSTVAKLGPDTWLKQTEAVDTGYPPLTSNGHNDRGDAVETTSQIVPPGTAPDEETLLVSSRVVAMDKWRSRKTTETITSHSQLDSKQIQLAIPDKYLAGLETVQEENIVDITTPLGSLSGNQIARRLEQVSKTKARLTVTSFTGSLPSFITQATSPQADGAVVTVTSYLSFTEPSEPVPMFGKVQEVHRKIADGLWEIEIEDIELKTPLVDTYPDVETKRPNERGDMITRLSRIVPAGTPPAAQSLFVRSWTEPIDSTKIRRHIETTDAHTPLDAVEIALPIPPKYLAGLQVTRTEELLPISTTIGSITSTQISRRLEQANKHQARLIVTSRVGDFPTLTEKQKSPQADGAEVTVTSTLHQGSEPAADEGFLIPQSVVRKIADNLWEKQTEALPAADPVEESYPLLTGQRPNSAGQLMGFATRIVPLGTDADTPTAITTSKVEPLDKWRSRKTTETVPSLFNAPQNSAQQPSVIPKEFYDITEEITFTEIKEGGSFADPKDGLGTNGLGEVSITRQQVDTHTYRDSMVWRAGTLHRQRDGERVLPQFGGVRGIVRRHVDPAAAIPTTGAVLSGEVQDIGNGEKLAEWIELPTDGSGSLSVPGTISTRVDPEMDVVITTLKFPVKTDDKQTAGSYILTSPTRLQVIEHEEINPELAWEIITTIPLSAAFSKATAVESTRLRAYTFPGLLNVHLASTYSAPVGYVRQHSDLTEAKVYTYWVISATKPTITFDEVSPGDIAVGGRHYPRVLHNEATIHYGDASIAYNATSPSYTAYLTSWAGQWKVVAGESKPTRYHKLWKVEIEEVQFPGIPTLTETPAPLE